MHIKTFSRITLILFLVLTSCDLKKGIEKIEANSNQKFEDQHFKTAISLIELHKVRYGVYPEKLDSLKYLGDWDQMITISVSYVKLEEGYQLDLVRRLKSKSKNVGYPDDFWQGLGCVKSNLK